MEEDIKILEDFKNITFLYGKLAITQEAHKSVSIAIGNLIKGYRELEESNKILQDAYWNECVPKSIIKEKIEDLYEDKDSKYYDMFLEQRDIEKTISVLQELMGDK